MDSNKLTQVLLAIVLLLGAYNAYQISGLKSRVSTEGAQARNAVSNASSNEQLNLGRLAQSLDRNMRLLNASHGYFELLLEGLTRKAGLPVDSARGLFEKRKGGVPSGWTWQPAWERETPAAKDQPSKTP
jgi:hypothetical protein